MATHKINFDLPILHLSELPEIKVAPPGPESKKLLDEQKRIESSAVSYPESIPLAIDEAKGATIRDVDGNIYLDFFGGAGVLNVGQLNPKVTRIELVAHRKGFSLL